MITFFAKVNMHEKTFRKGLWIPAMDSNIALTRDDGDIIMLMSDHPMQLRTQIYLEPAQHAALIKEARRLGISLAGMIRKLVEDHVLKKGEGAVSAQERKKAALSLMSLGASGLSDVSERADEHLGQAIYAEMVRDKRPRYKAARRKKRAG